MTAALAVVAGVVAAIGVAPSAAAGVSAGQTLRVSVRSDQQQADQPSRDPSVSGDGRYVVFSSLDHLDTAALVPDSSNSQIYVRDLMANTTRLLTFSYAIPENGDPVRALPASGTSAFPSISASGRFVAFQTDGDPTGSGEFRSKVILIDRDPDDDGVLDEPRGSTIERTYTLLGDPDALYPDAAYLPSIAEDLGGDETVDKVTVVYETVSYGSNSSSQLQVATVTPVAGSDPVQYTVARQSVYPQQSGLELRSAWAPAISADGGRVVAQAYYEEPEPEPIPFRLDPTQDAPALTAPAAASAASVASAVSAASAAQADPEVGERVVAFDLDAVHEGGGVPPSRVARLDVHPEGLEIAHRGGNRPQISGDGRKAVFEMSVDVCTSPSCEFPLYWTRAFIADPDPDGNGVIESPAEPPVVDTLSRDTSGGVVRGIMPTISADGRYAAFVTDEPETHNGVDWPLGDSVCAVPRFPPIPFTATAQEQSKCQIVVRDLVLDKQRLDDDASRLPGELATPSILRDCSDSLEPTDTCASDGIAEMPALAGNGSVVAFMSDAQDLASGDDNGEVDVYARRFTPTVQAEQIDFGGVQLGDEANAGTVVTAVGFGPLLIDTVTVSGGPDFTLGSQSCTPRAPMHAGDSCAVTVDFGPSTEGGRSGAVEITPRFLDPVKIPVRGLGTAVPQPDPVFELRPAALDFGERLIMTNSAAAVVTVRNAGGQQLVISGVSLPPLVAPSAPGDYRITANTCTAAPLPAGAACTVTLVHSPLGPGARPAVLQIDHQTSAGVQPHLVELRGAGIAPKLQINPAVVPIGRITSVIGTDFPPGRVVSIDMPGFPELVQATPDAAGTFTTLLLVYPNSVPGSRVVEATVDAAPTVGDTENILIVPGTLGPPDFLVRR